MISKNKKILITILVILTILSISGAVFYIYGKKGKTLSSQEVAKIAIDYINQNLLEKGTTASLISVIDEGQVYKVHLKVQEDEGDVYVTKDGKFLFPQVISLKTEPSTKKEENGSEITKRERPDVKLFVMSYCPYGLQMEKAFLPVYNLLKDKADMGVYFVNYILHGKQEVDENLREYCIQKEEKEKFSNYLSCFVKDGNFEKCLSEANIDREKLTSCQSETDKQYNIYSGYNDKSTWLNGQYPKFEIYNELNQQYGVSGSPTLVINDTLVTVDRSPEKIKEKICSAFNSPPEACSQTLSSDVPKSGFGEGEGSSTGGACQ